jgi:hypothetical protein
MDQAPFRVKHDTRQVQDTRWYRPRPTIPVPAEPGETAFRGTHAPKGIGHAG